MERGGEGKGEGGKETNGPVQELVCILEQPSFELNTLEQATFELKSPASLDVSRHALVDMQKGSSLCGGKG